MAKDDGRVVTNFINQALFNENITIYGDGSQTRSFQYVDDLIEAMTRVMKTDNTFHGPINLGNPHEFTVKELAELTLELIKDSKSKYTVQLGRKFKERPHIEDETEQIIIEENIHLYNDYIEIVSSNTLEAPNDHVLFENLTSSIVYRNVKTKEENTKDITTLLNGLAKVYNIHDLYNFIYKDQMNESIFDLNNPGSAGNPSSSITSSMFK